MAPDDFKTRVERARSDDAARREAEDEQRRAEQQRRDAGATELQETWRLVVAVRDGLIAGHREPDIKQLLPSRYLTEYESFDKRVDFIVFRSVIVKQKTRFAQSHSVSAWDLGLTVKVTHDPHGRGEHDVDHGVHLGGDGSICVLADEHSRRAAGLNYAIETYAIGSALDGRGHLSTDIVQRGLVNLAVRHGLDVS